MTTEAIRPEGGYGVCDEIWRALPIKCKVGVSALAAMAGLGLLITSAVYKAKGIGGEYWWPGTTYNDRKFYAIFGGVFVAMLPLTLCTYYFEKRKT
jgi:hypothetical protein